jgi:proteasome lid subunit RPN8/RPN11
MSAVAFSIKPTVSFQKEDYLEVLIPKFESGPYPPSMRRCVPLCPAYDRKSDLPFYVTESLIRKALIEDEARFRREHPIDWHERCWFILGKILRDPDGKLWGNIQRIIPACHLETSYAFFEFSPETWMVLREEIRKSRELVLGWVHTHSVTFLNQMGRKALLEMPAQAIDTVSKDMVCQTEAKRSANISSGLFLSTTDTESAMKRGFNAAYQLTCILDSDAIEIANEKNRLDRAIGVWGYFENTLRPSSFYIIRADLN